MMICEEKKKEKEKECEKEKGKEEIKDVQEMSEVKKFLEIGNNGIQFFQKKSYNVAKILLLQCIEGLIKLFKDLDKKDTKSTELIKPYFFYVEECNKSLSNVNKINVKKKILIAFDKK